MVMGAFAEGVCRNPGHPKGRRVFATNFDNLKFKVDGVEYPAKDVVGAFPHIKTLVLFDRDSDGEIRFKRELVPLTKGAFGEIEIIGTPAQCTVCMSALLNKVEWWKEPLVSD